MSRSRSTGIGARGCRRSLSGRSSGGRILARGVTEDVVVVSALAGDARLEGADVLALGEAVDAAVVVVLAGGGILAALVHHVGDVAADDGGAGSVRCWDLPDAAAAAGSVGCAD